MPYTLRTGITPSALRLLDPDNVPDLRLISPCGEALPLNLALAWVPYAKVLNGFGPTECTVYATTYMVQAHDKVMVRRRTDSHMPLNSLVQRTTTARQPRLT